MQLADEMKEEIGMANITPRKNLGFVTNCSQVVWSVEPMKGLSRMWFCCPLNLTFGVYRSLAGEVRSLERGRETGTTCYKVSPSSLDLSLKNKDATFTTP